VPDRRGGLLRLLRRGGFFRVRGRLYMHRPDGAGRFCRQAVVSLAWVSQGCPVALPHGLGVVQLRKGGRCRDLRNQRVSTAIA